jgi:hypothetical protein
MDLNIDGRLDTMHLLVWAVKRGSLELVELVLDMGADPNTPQQGWYTQYPLKKAVEMGNQEIIKLLTQRTNRIGRTKALCNAVDRQDNTTVKTLLDCGARCEYILLEQHPHTDCNGFPFDSGFQVEPDDSKFTPPALPNSCLR